MSPLHVAFAAGNLKLPLAELNNAQDEGTAERLLVMLLIFAVSFFAVSFPTITATFRAIRVPSILFFVGKHFGTGVILSTAFVHLLQDAFKALQTPIVNERWKIGNWTGIIVLGSLISIFLVEYISTAYVDRLQSYSSLPSTPTASPTPSATPSLIEVPPSIAPSHHAIDTPPIPSGVPIPFSSSTDTDETTPLHPNLDTLNEAPSLIPPTYGATAPSRPVTRPNRLAHSSAPPGDEFFSGGHHRHEPRDSHVKHHADVSRWRWLASLWNGRPSGDAVHAVPEGSYHSYSQGVVSPPKTPQRAVRDSSNTGHGRGSSRPHAHAHADMEQWMTGIDGEGHRHSHGSAHGDEESRTEPGEDEEMTKVGRRRQIIGILVLQLGIMIHSLVIGLTLSITSGSEFTSLVIAIVFHQLFEGLSLGIRIAGLPSSESEHGFRHLPGHTLKPLLAFTFAVTTPLGIGIGLVTLGGVKTKAPHLILVQGVMSAISAGMLIYAACVEMLAGDFVMDAHLWRSSIWRQALALGSLFLGAVAMSVIGIFD